jgi:hypothetical protein
MAALKNLKTRKMHLRVGIERRDEWGFQRGGVCLPFLNGQKQVVKQIVRQPT